MAEVCMAMSANCPALPDEPEGEFGPAGGRVRLTPVDEAFLQRYAVRRSERVFVLCDCVLDIAAAFFNVPTRELRRPGRCPDDISRVRQIGMYVTHVVLRFSMAEVGKGFGRDRTTVMHACHIIEDMRDDREFDAMVARLERVVAAALRGREAAAE
jgi:hypothetical protein